MNSAIWHNYCTLAYVAIGKIIFCESTIFWHRLFCYSIELTTQNNITITCYITILCVCTGHVNQFNFTLTRNFKLSQGGGGGREVGRNTGRIGKAALRALKDLSSDSSLTLTNWPKSIKMKHN